MTKIDKGGFEVQEDIHSKLGKSYEEDFRSRWKGRNCYIWRIPDYALSANRSQTPADYLIVENGKSTLFEVKSTKSLTSFSIDNFTDNQLIQLRKHKIDGLGDSYIVFYNPNGMWIVDIMDILDYIMQNTRKSIPFPYIVEKDISEKIWKISKSLNTS